MSLSVTNLMGGGGKAEQPYAWRKYNVSSVIGALDETVSSLPYDFSLGSAVVYNDEIHILGSTSTDCKTYHYKWDGSTWTSVSTLPYEFWYASAVVYNNEIHIISTYGSNNRTSHYKWDGTSWTSVSTLPYNSYGGSAVVYNDEIHILGSNYASSCYQYHYKWDGTSWTSVSTLPYQFRLGSAVVYNNEIHILGSAVSGAFTSHYKWDGTSWTSVSTLPYNFYTACAVVYNNEIHIIGSGNSASTDVEKQYYKWNGSTWTSVVTLNFNFYYGCAVVYNDEIHILGGGSTKVMHKKTYGYVWSYTLFRYVVDKNANAYPDKEIASDGYYYEKSSTIKNGTIVEAFSKSNIINAPMFVEFESFAESVSINVGASSSMYTSATKPSVIALTDSVGAIFFPYGSYSYHYLYGIPFTINDSGVCTFGSMVAIQSTKYNGECICPYKIDDTTVGLFHKRNSSYCGDARVTITLNTNGTPIMTFIDDVILASYTPSQSASTTLTNGNVLVMSGYSGYACLTTIDVSSRTQLGIPYHTMIDDSISSTMSGASFSNPIAEDTFIMTYSHGYSLYACICKVESDTSVTVKAKTLIEGSVASAYRTNVYIAVEDDSHFTVFASLGDSNGILCAIKCKYTDSFITVINVLTLSGVSSSGVYFGAYNDGRAILLSTLTDYSNSYYAVNTVGRGGLNAIFSNTSYIMAGYSSHGIKMKDYILFAHTGNNTACNIVSVCNLKNGVKPSEKSADGVLITQATATTKGKVYTF